MSEIAYTPLNQSKSYIQGQSIRKSFYDLLFMYGQFIIKQSTTANIETVTVYEVPANKIAFIVGWNHFLTSTNPTSSNQRGYIKINDVIVNTIWHVYDPSTRWNDESKETTQSFAIPLKLNTGDKIKLITENFTSQASSASLFIYELDINVFQELYKN